MQHRLARQNDQPLEVSYLCEQQYKHAMGCAEALCKLPESMVMNELATIESSNRPARQHDPMATKCKKGAKTVLATRPVRRALISLCELTGRIVPEQQHECQIAIVRDRDLFCCGLSRRFTAIRSYGCERITSGSLP